MKKAPLVLLIVILTMAMAFASPIEPVLISAPAAAFTINGVTLPFDFKQVGDEVLIPLRSVSETLGYKVIWEPETKRIIVQKGARIITVETLKNGYALSKMAPEQLSMKPIIENGVAYVPIVFIETYLEAYAGFDNGSITIEGNLQGNVQTGGIIIDRIEGETIYATLNGQEVHIKLSDTTTYSEYGTEAAIALSDLKPGDQLVITHLPYMIMIYPPQYAAQHIERISDAVFVSGIVTEKGEDWVMVGTLEDGVRLSIGDETAILRGHEAIGIEDVRLGNRINAYHSLMSTRSIPPQSSAFRIIVQ